MLREEEDDITQEMRQMIMLKTKEELDKYGIKKVIVSSIIICFKTILDMF
jgi:hypothetical protein